MIQNETNRNEYSGNGVATVYAYTFRVDAKTEIDVLVGGVVKVVDTDYTVSSVGADGGGNITFTVAPASGANNIVFLRKVPGTQLVDLVEGGPLSAATLEKALDKLTMFVQQTRETLARAIGLAKASLFENLTIPDPIAGRFLRWKGDLSGLENIEVDPATAGVEVITTEGDLIQGGVAGVPERLPIGGATDLLGKSGNKAAWRTVAQVRDTLDIPAQRREVVMTRTTDSGNDPSVTPATWIVYDPDGVAIDTSASTTQGLQEAINYATQHGFDLKVLGGGLKPEVFGVPYGGALGNNPFATVNGSAVVTVTHTAHGLTTGKKIYFLGLSGAVNNIPAAEFGVSRVVTVVNANSYTITLVTLANATGSGGGATVRFQHAGQNVAIISCTTPITVPPLQGVRWDIHATINFGGSGGAVPGIRFDSIMASDIKFSDQIVVAGTYAVGMRFKPTLELPFDPFGPVITSSYIELPSVVMVGGTGNNIDFDASSASISSNIFKLIEPNEGDIGILVQAGASSTFDHNHIDVVDVHGQGACINAGLSATHGANIFGNTWNVQCDPQAGGVGVEIFGRNEHWIISVTNLEGQPATGITLNTSAAQNIINILRNDATLKINDVATVKSNTIITPRVYLRAHKNGTNQTGIVTATLTDITFGTEVLDTAAAFDGTTFTAPYPGTYQVSARVGWVVSVDATLQATRILKNSVGILDHYSYASSVGGSQGAHVSADVELAAGDTIKIQGRQDSGVNQDVNGTAATTWLTIARV